MNPWIVVGGIASVILLGLILLFVVRVSVTIELKKEFYLTLWLFGIPIRILPVKKREKKYNFRRYTLKKIRKREARAARRAEKRRLRKLKKQQEAPQTKKETEKKESSFDIRDVFRILEKISDATPPVTDLIPLLCRVIALFASRFFGRLHIKVARLHVRIGASDAMQTAVLFGVVNQSVQYMMVFLKKVCRLDGFRRADIQVYPDFLSEEMELDFKITLGMSLGAVVLACLRTLFAFIRGYLKIRPTASNPKRSLLPPLPPLPYFPARPSAPDAPVERD